MNKTIKLSLQELLITFSSPFTYLIASIFYLINGVLFWFLVSQSSIPGQSSVSNIMNHMTGGIVFWLLVLAIIPTLSMKFFAIEKERKTISLLFTLPLQSWQIVLGKFIAGVLTFFALWVPFIYYFFLLRLQCPLDPGPLLSSFLGLILLSMFLVSIGLFTSALSKDQLSSAFFTFSTLLLPLVISMFELLVSSATLKKFFLSFNYIQQYLPFSEGIIDTRSIVFFITTSILFLILTTETINYRRHHYGN